MMMTSRHRLSRADSLIVARIEIAIPALATARSLTDRFADMVRTGRAEDLPDWLSEAEPSPLASFARGLRAFVTAVTAGLRETWPNGQREGQINRLKTLNRRMYGRAGIDLLRARFVATP
jgi:transposase